VKNGKRKHIDIYASPISDWHAADNICQGKNMNLVTFETYAEAEYFKNQVANKLKPQWDGENKESRGIWVGINDLKAEGNFVQVNGVPTPTLPWSPSDPNNFGGAENCVFSDINGFFDGPCEWALGFACEWFEATETNQDVVYNFV
jgi:hypothetical protein